MYMMIAIGLMAFGLRPRGRSGLKSPRPPRPGRLNLSPSSQRSKLRIRQIQDYV